MLAVFFFTLQEKSTNIFSEQDTNAGKYNFDFHQVIV